MKSVKSGSRRNYIPALRKGHRAGRRGKLMATDRTFGISTETESSWEATLSDAHSQFLLAFIEAEQQREQAVIEAFLKES
jgi:hypothetical protein